MGEALPPEALAVLSGPVGEAVARAAGYAGRALSDNTRRAYESDWRAFCAWCEAGGIAPLAAAPVVVAGRPLRHVQLLPSTLDGRKKRMIQLRLGFWSADWSPWAAIARLRRAWPELSFEMTPHYLSAAGAEAEEEKHSPASLREETGRNRKAKAGARRRG